MKKSTKSTIILNIVGFIIGVFGFVLQFFKLSEGCLFFAQLVLLTASMALLILPWLAALNKILKRLSITAGIAEGLPAKLNELSIWRRNEQPEKIRITVSDFDDYLILLPLHLSIPFLKGMDVEFETSCCGSDMKALEKLASGSCKFAITDPYYLKMFPTAGFVLLAPLIMKSPMWWLSKNSCSEASRSSPVRIFSYESKNKKREAQTYTGRMLETQIQKSVSGSYEVYTIKKVVKELCRKLRESNVVQKGDRSLIDMYGGLDKIEEKEESIAAFECLLFSCCIENSEEVVSIGSIVREYFQQFDYFLLTEPDSSFVAQVLGCSAEQVSLDGGESIFTGIITTREYLYTYPVESLKMLRGLRDGLLKSNIALMNKDAKTIKKAFQKAIDYKRGGFEKEQKKHLFINAFLAIDRFLLDESFFSDDLILLDTGMRFTPDEAPFNEYVRKYGNYILQTTDAGGKESDLKNESIKFIIKGLGYDC